MLHGNFFDKASLAWVRRNHPFQARLRPTFPHESAPQVQDGCYLLKAERAGFGAVLEFMRSGRLPQHLSRRDLVRLFLP